MFISSFDTGVSHRQATNRYNSGNPIMNTGYIEVVGKGIFYPHVQLNHLGTRYKYPTLVLNVGGFSSANELGNSVAYGGALCLGVPDGTLVGGNVRGFGAADLQSSRGSATQVASGAYSAILGSSSTANNTGSIAIGYNSTSSGVYSTTIGANNTATGTSSIAMGLNCSASNANSITIGNNLSGTHESHIMLGKNGASRVSNGLTHSFHGASASNGKAQEGHVALACTTTSATAVVATSDTTGATAVNQYVFALNSVNLIRYELLGISSTNTVTVRSGNFCMKKGATASTTALLGLHTTTKTFGDTALDACTITVTANTTLGCPTVSIVGVASTTIKWICKMTIIEHAY